MGRLSILDRLSTFSYSGSSFFFAGFLYRPYLLRLCNRSTNTSKYLTSNTYSNTISCLSGGVKECTWVEVATRQDAFTSFYRDGFGPSQQYFFCSFSRSRCYDLDHWLLNLETRLPPPPPYTRIVLHIYIYSSFILLINTRQ